MGAMRGSFRRCRRATVAFAVSVLVVFAVSVGIAWAAANPVLTPGVTDPRVTNVNVRQTICVRGYTRTVRSVSSAVKRLVYAEYGITSSERRRYVIDHLIPLEVGGADDSKNLWPEPKTGDQSAEAKDHVENDLHDRVCAGLMSLQVAQETFVIYWGGGNARTASPSVPASTPEPGSTAPGATGPTARCNDGSYSYAAHHQGACSRHGGVAEFYR
jgi:hypothetical protein